MAGSPIRPNWSTLSSYGYAKCTDTDCRSILYI